MTTSNRGRDLAALLALVALLVGCVHAPAAPRLERFDPSRASRSFGAPDRSDELFFVLAFSGGGMRASALSYGVLEALSRVALPPRDGAPRSLLAEVDLVSAVSGGSFTAAYFGIKGAAIFDDFEERYLSRDIGRALFWRQIAPWNWVRLASPYFGVSDLAAEYYDTLLFDGATLSEFDARGRPAVDVQATDIAELSQFGFSRTQLSRMCIDFDEFPVSRAVSASSAIPIVFSPITLRNHAGSCGFTEEPWVASALASSSSGSRRFQLARHARAYEDADQLPYIHLLDGAISDSLGLRGPLDAVILRSGVSKAMEDFGIAGTRRIAVIVVNAQTRPTSKLSASPSVGALLDSISAMVVNRYNFETLELLRSTFEQWSQEIAGEARATAGAATSDPPVSFYVIELSFEKLQDAQEAKALSLMPTNMNLDAESLARLRSSAEKLLWESPEFQRLVADLAGQREARGGELSPVSVPTSSK